MARTTALKPALRRLALCAAAACAALLIAACGAPQDDMGGMDMGSETGSDEERQEFAFTGTVQGVDSARNIVSVANDEIPGWMMAMTMNFYVQPAEIIDSLEAGDRITATVYSGDFQNLYEVELVPDP